MYSTQIKILIITASILALTACGGGNGGGEQPTAKSMVVGQTYIMKKGQNIVRKKEPTKIEVSTDIDTGISTAKLISGAADIE
jgi:hypothetical protein